MVDVRQVSGGVNGRAAEADRGVLVGLQTNNPRKINMLKSLGVAITERIPCLVQSQEFNQGYLAVKAARMSHVRPRQTNNSWASSPHHPGLCQTARLPLLNYFYDSVPLLNISYDAVRLCKGTGVSMAAAALGQRVAG